MSAAISERASRTCASSSRGRRGAPIPRRSAVSTSVPQRRLPVSARTACAAISPRSVRWPISPPDESMLLSALSTDLYELTMIGGYYVTGLTGRATFDLFVRQLPPTRNYLVAAGLEQALDFLESLRFTGADIDYLRTVPALQQLPRHLFDEYLADFRFTGDVSAIEEGTPVFAQEPIIRVTAPLAEAQLIEPALIAETMFPTWVASRA